MPDSAFRDAIVDTLRDELARTSDRILRIEASRDWPVPEALRQLGRDCSLRILVRRPFKLSTFSSLKATDDAGEATAWRNKKPRDFHVIIVGGNTGTLDAGLKDVRKIDRRVIIDRWRATTLAGLSKDNDLAKAEVRNLLVELFSDVKTNIIPATHLQNYLEAIRQRPHVGDVCSSLWHVGLMTDPQAVDRGMVTARATRNRELVEHLRTSDDSRVDKVLKKFAHSSDTVKANVAKAAIQFRETSNPRLLHEIDMPTLEDMFRAAPPNTSTVRSVDLTGLLDMHFDSVEEVRDCIERLGSKWKLDEIHECLEVDLKTSTDSLTVRVELRPATTEPQSQDQEAELLCPWTGESEDDPVLAASSKSIAPERLSPGQTVFRASDLQSIGQAYAPNEVAAYLTARKALLAFEPWLEHDAIALFLLKPDALNAVDDFIHAWSDLAAGAIGSQDAPEFVETVQVLETVSGPSGAENWIVLGPLHPFRLDPLLRACQQARQRLGEPPTVASLGTALEWTLDKCFPAYPTLHRKENTFFYSAEGSLHVFRQSGREFLRPVHEHGGLDRIVRAIESYSPWLRSGLSALAIDPPTGGGVVKAFSLARRRYGGDRKVVVNHLTTGHEADSLDGFDGELRYLPRVSKLEDAVDLPDVNVVLRFVAESPSSGEAASANWQATRGTHLALQITESLGGPFAGKRTPKIKIDPRAGNVVVRRTQQLYAKFKGGLPVLATMRPLLQTDEAPVLSRMASKTDWVVFAAPGPLGLVSPRTINSTLRFVGRANMGLYGLYAYAADDLFPVRRHFEDYFQKTPVATVSPQKMVELLVAKAQESGHAVLFAGLSSVPEQLACLVALEIAKEDAGGADEVFVLSLDDLGWTQAWSRPGTRADFLVVVVRDAGDIIFRVVESKSQEGGSKTPCEKSAGAFPEAIMQVRGSLDSLKEITKAAAPSLDEDLRFASLIEHLMAAVMARTDELKGATRERVFDAINALSRRERVPSFEGLAILTQVGLSNEREQRKIDDEIRIVWAGAKEIERTFKVPAYVLTRRVPVSATAPQEPTPSTASEQPEAPGGTLAVEQSLDGQPEAEPIGTAVADEGADSQLISVPGPSPIAELARGFIAAARIHGIAVADNEPAYLQAGPSLFALGIRLREGAAIQPLRVRLSDIARDVGLGDRAHEIDVDNDAAPRTVRVLLPRPDREFPSLPDATANALSSDGSYLPVYIGQTVDGRDFGTPIEQWPHMLIAGTTGSGKTTFVKSILRQLGAFGPGLLQTAVVDGKGETDYFGLLPKDMFPTEFSDIQLGHSCALDVLRWAVEEMERRRQKIVDLARKSPSSGQGVKATDLYRNAIRERRTPEIRPLVLVIDEFADIMLASKKVAEDFENLVQRVSQVGRSRLIHLILATQRPDKETIRGAIKANLNARAVFRLPTQADSLTVLGQAGAERLMLHGDMLFQHGTGVPVRLQGYRV